MKNIYLKLRDILNFGNPLIVFLGGISLFLSNFIGAESLDDTFTSETLNITLSIDVAGTVTVIPFLQLPNGIQRSLKPITISNVTGYIFQSIPNGPTFSIKEPKQGLYITGVQICGSASVVQLNSNNTLFSTLIENQHIRPTSPNNFSVTLGNNENDCTQLLVPWVYTPLE